MYQCKKCGLWKSEYDYENKQFKCIECNYIEKVTWKLVKCRNCGSFLSRYTVFDPSGCSYCGKSFIN